MRRLYSIAACTWSLACGPAEGPPSSPPPEVPLPRLTLVDERIFVSSITGGDTHGDDLLLATRASGVLRFAKDGSVSEVYPEQAAVRSVSATVAVIFPGAPSDAYEIWDLRQPERPLRLAEQRFLQPGVPRVELRPQRGPVRPGVLDVALYNGSVNLMIEVDVSDPLVTKQRVLVECDGPLWSSPNLVLCSDGLQLGRPTLDVWRRDAESVIRIAQLPSSVDGFVDVVLDHDRAILTREDASVAMLIVTGTTARLTDHPEISINGAPLLGLFGDVLLTAGPAATILRWDLLPGGGFAPTPRPLSIGAPLDDFGFAIPVLLGQSGPLLYAAFNGTIASFELAGTATAASPLWSSYGGIQGLRQMPSGSILTLTDRGLLSQSEESLLQDPAASPPKFGRVQSSGVFIVDEGLGGLYVRGGDALSELRPLTLDGVVGERRFLITRPTEWEAPVLVPTTHGCRAFVTWNRPKKKRAAISRIDLCPGGPINQVFREISLPGPVTLFDHGASITLLEGAQGEQTSLLDPLSGEVLDSYAFGGVTSAAADSKAWVLGVGPEMIHIRPSDGAPRTLYLPGAGGLSVLAVGWPHIYVTVSAGRSLLWVVNGESGVVEERIASNRPIRDVIVGQRGVFVSTDTRLRSFVWRTP